MKKILALIIILLCGISSAYADVCYDITQEIADKAVEIIKQQKIVYDFCSICSDAKPLKIKVKEVQNSNPVKINGNPIDLAHIYYKKDHKYINLGIKTGCINDGDYYISAELDELQEIHHTKENDKVKAKSQVQETLDACAAGVKKMPSQTTADMIQQSSKYNDCLNAAIEKEIEKGFAPELQKEMLHYLKQLKNSAFNFYDGIYAKNKYCYGSCGTMANILPFNDENKLLIEILEKLVYLNITRNGY